MDFWAAPFLSCKSSNDWIGLNDLSLKVKYYSDILIIKIDPSYPVVKMKFLSGEIHIFVTIPIWMFSCSTIFS